MYSSKMHTMEIRIQQFRRSIMFLVGLFNLCIGSTLCVSRVLCTYRECFYLCICLCIIRCMLVLLYYANVSAIIYDLPCFSTPRPGPKAGEGTMFWAERLAPWATSSSLSSSLPSLSSSSLSSSSPSLSLSLTSASIRKSGIKQSNPD